MAQILNLTTNSLLGYAGRVYSVSAMAATAGIGVQMQLCGLLCSKTILQHKNLIPQSSQAFASTSNGKRLCFLVQKEPTNSLHRGPPFCMSIDVEKEDNSSVDLQMEGNASADLEIENNSSVNPRIGLEEKFAVINTGKSECRSCGYVYDQSFGDQFYPIPPGIEFSKLPADWRCPTCGAAKSYFISKSVEVAGFAQNQQFGLGGNTLTSGQKSLLIYGSLLFFFALFLGGYFLQ
eukprot:Gb_24370 [translate_table: standard]